MWCYLACSQWNACRVWGQCSPRPPQPPDAYRLVYLQRTQRHTHTRAHKHTHTPHTHLLLRGQQKGPLPVGRGQQVPKSASWKNSQLLSTWPYTIKAILKGNTKWPLPLLFHPPFSPCGQTLSRSPPPLCLPPLPLFRVQSEPHGWTRCILYYSFMYFKRQTAQFPPVPASFHLLLLPFTLFFLDLPASCKAINHPIDLICRGERKVVKTLETGG